MFSFEEPVFSLFILILVLCHSPEVHGPITDVWHWSYRKTWLANIEKGPFVKAVSVS